MPDLDATPEAHRTKEPSECAREEAVPAMIRVDGKRFACICGCNVFTRTGDKYRCNGCPREYLGLPAADIDSSTVESAP